MPDELLFGVRMLAFTQSRKVFGTNATLQPPLLGEPALPLTVTLLIAAPIMVQKYLRLLPSKPALSTKMSEFASASTTSGIRWLLRW
jgi:hypothetical protein